MSHTCEESITRRPGSRLPSGVCGRPAVKEYNLLTGGRDRAHWIAVCPLHLRAALARWPGYDVRDLSEGG
jgi:hypothetical protein